MPGMLPTPVRMGAGLILLLMVQGCGGGGGGGGGDSTQPPPQLPAISQFSADQAAYFVGDQARLTAVYANGTGHIEPGHIPIQSGGTITTPLLKASTSWRLVVSGSGGTAERELALTVDYRGQLRPLAMPFRRAEHTASILKDGRVLIAGGFDSNLQVLSAAEVFE